MECRSFRSCEMMLPVLYVRDMTISKFWYLWIVQFIFSNAFMKCCNVRQRFFLSSRAWRLDGAIHCNARTAGYSRRLCWSSAYSYSVVVVEYQHAFSD